MSVQIPLFGKAEKKASRIAVEVEEIVGDSFDVKKFVENFEALAEASGGVPALRRLVLELAIRGRFTDSSANAQANSSGPFLVPENWRWAQGEDLFTFVTSGSRGWAQFYADEGPIFLRIGNLDYQTTDLDLRSIQHVQPPPNAEGVRTQVQPGDILISITGDTGMVGLVPPNLGEAYINQHIALARPSSAAFPPFVARALTAPSLLGRLQSAQRGIKNSLGLDDVRKLAVPLPPLAEQKRIVAKVDQLMALCDGLEARQTKKRETGARLTKSALEALTTAEGPEEFDAAWKRVVENFDVLIDRAEKVGHLRRTVLELAVRGRLVPPSTSSVEVESLLEAVGKQQQSLLEGKRKGGRGHGEEDVVASGQAPYEIPAGWRWCALGDVAGHIVDGTHHTPRYVERGMDFISAKDIRNGSITFDGCKQISREEFDELTKRCRPKRGDVLVTKSGSIGEVALVETDRPFTLFESVAVVPVVPALNSQYVAYVVFLGASGQFGAENQRGVAVRHLHLVDLRKLPLPLPPRKEQDAIVAKVEALLKHCDQFEDRLRQAEDRASKLVEAVVQELVA